LIEDITLLLFKFSKIKSLTTDYSILQEWYSSQVTQVDFLFPHQEPLTFFLSLQTICLCGAQDRDKENIPMLCIFLS